MSERSDHEGLKNIFTHLADMELKHIEVIREMRNERYILKRVDTLEKEKSLFKDLKREPVPVKFPEDEVKIYQDALKREDDSRDFYLEQAEKALDPDAERVFQRLAQEEMRHAMILKNVIDFVYKPQWWVENAEFNPSEDDYS
jgi:rubrerythrin